MTSGSGEKKFTCGTYHRRVLCPDDPTHHDQNIPHTCYLPTCPVCWPKWAARLAKSSSQTIFGYKRAHHGHHDPWHLTLSPPDRIIPKTEDPGREDLEWLLTWSNRLLDDLGIKAAAVIPHPFRIRDEWREIAETAARAAGVNRYEWAFSQPNWREIIYYSPHVHLLGYGFLMNSKQFQERTGWVYRNHGRRDEETLPGTIYYLLSHAWVVGNPKVVRYWRGMSPTKLGVVVKHLRFNPTCAVCGALLVVVHEGDKYQDLHNANKAYRTLESRTYFVRKRKRKPIWTWPK